MKVMKFGGASLTSGKQYAAVARLVAGERGPRIVVASAMEGITDRILDALPAIRRSEDEARACASGLARNHDAACREALRTKPEHDRVSSELHELLARLERVLYGIAYTEELTPKTRDLVASFGERLSVRLLAACLREAGVRSEALDADKAGIVTNGVFGSATPILDEIEDRLTRDVTPHVESGLVPVMTGFFGADRDGHVTTFGRGGSDYSAAILANALNAERLEVWKDVDGFLTADPRLVPEARPIKEMSYDEAAELSYLGSEILHPRTVEPLQRKGIPIVIRNTLRPAVQGTIIEAARPEHSREFRGVAVKDGLAILKLSGPGMAYTPGIGAKVFSAMGDAGVNVYNMAASQASFALLVNEADVSSGLEALQTIVGGVVKGVEATRERTLVCFVGQGIGNTPGVAGSIFSAVGSAGVNVEMIMVGASEFALNFVVGSRQTRDAVKALHDAFLVKPLHAGEQR